MKLIKTLSLGIIVCSLTLTSLAASSESTVNYKNQRGSTMTLVFHPGEQKNAGTVTGIFTTAVGDCKADVGVPLPLSGYYNANAVALTVNFPHCHYVVSMTGNLTDHSEKLFTHWLAASPAQDPQGEDWNSNIIGSDSYIKTRS